MNNARLQIAFEALTLLVQQADFDKKHELIINVVNSTLSGQKDNEKLLDALLETLSQVKCHTLVSIKHAITS